MNNITITVDKSKLLEVLDTNATNHRKLFEEAWDAYAGKVIEVITEQLALAKDRDPSLNPAAIHQLSRPEDHSVDYQRTIEMLGWHTGDTVQLEEQEFDNYVKDDWGWKRVFEGSYTSNTGRKVRKV